MFECICRHLFKPQQHKTCVCILKEILAWVDCGGFGVCVDDLINRQILDKQAFSIYDRHPMGFCTAYYIFTTWFNTNYTYLNKFPKPAAEACARSASAACFVSSKVRRSCTQSSATRRDSPCSWFIYRNTCTKSPCSRQ